MSKRKRAREGDIFKINLLDGLLSFGGVAGGNDCAFFDQRGKEIPPLEEIVSRKVIFRVMVDDEAISSGRWKVIGNLPLKGALAELAAYRNQPVGSNQLFVYRGGDFRPATLDETKDLELLSTWFDVHVEERLMDHFLGRKNRTVEYFKIIKRYDPSTGQEIKQANLISPVTQGDGDGDGSVGYRPIRK